MPTTLIVVGLCFLLAGVLFLRAAPAAVRRGRWAGGGVRALLGLLLLALGALAATITIGIHGYRALTLEVLAANVKTEPVGSQRFRATIVLPDRRLAMYELAGDAFYIDAHILKWHPAANLLGLHTAYELDRVGGRYNAIADERTKPHTMYSLARARRLDLFSLVRRFPLFRPLVDAEYGSAAFVAATRPVEYEVRVSTTGLLMRPIMRR
ncbi:MAG TPA: hypothetical protein VIW28_05915 [Gemmatimonadales bacterium]|jgi:hypothetical protein